MKIKDKKKDGLLTKDGIRNLSLEVCVVRLDLNLKNKIKEAKKILICGDRNWNNSDTIRKFMRYINSESIIIYGGCRGVDQMARTIVSKEFSIEVQVFLAEWERFGRVAGILRNIRMLKQEPDLVVGFHNDIKSSKGTKDMLNRAVKAGIQTMLFTDWTKISIEGNS